MQTHLSNPVLTLGEFIACMYNACAAPQARLLVWLAVHERLVVFKEEHVCRGSV
jgi:hypothetical protein